jgi:hypothetical protein
LDGSWIFIGAREAAAIARSWHVHRVAIPAQAGIHGCPCTRRQTDSGLRRNDDKTRLSFAEIMKLLSQAKHA